jgi:hypothetical protein
MDRTKSNRVIRSLNTSGTITDSVPICLTGTGLLEIKYERDGECGVGRTTSLGRAQATGIKHPV